MLRQRSENSYGDKPRTPEEEQGNSTHESEKDRPEREIRDISSYLEVLQRKHRELTGEDTADPS